MGDVRSFRGNLGILGYLEVGGLDVGGIGGTVSVRFD